MIASVVFALTTAPALGPSPPDSVVAACEVARGVVQSVLGLEPRVQPDIEVRHPFVAGAAGARRGCRVSAHSDDRPGAPVDAVVEALQAEGWRLLLAYMADGPDGSTAGFEVGPVLCIVEGRWDGGDDADPTYVPAPGYELAVGCFRPTAAEDRR